MMQAKHKVLKATYDKVCGERFELLQRIQDAEKDMRQMESLMSEYKRQGKQSEFEEVDNSYQQAPSRLYANVETTRSDARDAGRNGIAFG